MSIVNTLKLPVNKCHVTYVRRPADRKVVGLKLASCIKLCVKISILVHRRMWVRSFSTRLTSVTFAEDKVLIFLILRKNAKID